MELKEVLSISGNGGLFKFVSQSRNGIIVEHLENKQRSHISSTTRVSSLGDIAIYSEDQEVALASVLLKIQEKSGGNQVDCSKFNNDSYKKFFAEILPDYDREKVYVSDIKKVINWYNCLQKCNMLGILAVKEESTAKEEQENA
jgi:hypothetical protein